MRNVEPEAPNIILLLFSFSCNCGFLGLLGWGGVCNRNPAGTTINYTLTGGPDCINRGAIKTDEEKNTVCT